jgi:hypothetical protein
MEAERVRKRRVVERILPTPETLHKQRYDVVANLLARGQLNHEQAKAADEIRGVFSAVGRGMFPSSGWTPRISKLPRTRPARDFIDCMTPAECYAWEFNYLPWTREMALQIVALPGTTWLQLIIDVVVENEFLNTVERRYGLASGHGVAGQYLRHGLHNYMMRMRSSSPNRL